MPDPLTVLPYGLWTWCVAFAIDGREAGPLELLGISRLWDMALVDTPSLWNQIYVQNGEDEIARVAVFLHLSRSYSLHVDILTALPTMDSLHLIADHISRVTTILIRPGSSDTVTALHMEWWKQVPSGILVRLTNGLLPSDVKYASCVGISIRENTRLYYCIVLMQFTIATTGNGSYQQNETTSAGLPLTAYSRMWEEHVSRASRIPADQDADARTDSIYSLAKLASYAQYHGAIRIAIPSCIKLLKDDDGSVRSAAIDALHQFAEQIELREAVGLAMPSLIELLEDEHQNIRRTAHSRLEELCRYDELYEALGLTIPALMKLLKHEKLDVRSAAVSLLGKLAEHGELHEAIMLTIPRLVRLLEYKHSGVVLAASSLLGTLAKHDKLHKALSLTIPSLIKLLQRGYWRFRPVIVSLLEKMAEYDELREALRPIIPVLTKLLDKSLARPDAASLLEKLAKYDEFREAIRIAVPDGEFRKKFLTDRLGLASLYQASLAGGMRPNPRTKPLI